MLPAYSAQTKECHVQHSINSASMIDTELLVYGSRIRFGVDYYEYFFIKYDVIHNIINPVSTHGCKHSVSFTSHDALNGTY